MDEKLWRIVPVVPTDGDREVVDEVNAHDCEYALAIWRVAQARKCREERVAGACNRVRAWVEYERRTRSGRMLPEELREFRKLLGWEPLQGPWKAFANYMENRIGSWGEKVGGYLRGLPVGQFDEHGARVVDKRRKDGRLIGHERDEIYAHLSRLIAELPDGWDPRPVRRFVPGMPSDRKGVYLSSPFYRWVG